MVKRKKKTFFDKIDRERFSLVQPLCEHFGECGGCTFQDISYANQIQLKKEYLKDLFKQDIDVVPAIQEYNYRNRMDFVYAFKKLGLRKKGNFKEVVEINECKLVPQQFQALFQKVKTLLKEKNIDSYDFLEHKGFLRYVTFRYAPVNGEVLVFFSSTTPNKEQEEQLKELIEEIRNDVTSVYWQINDSITDTSMFFDKPVYAQLGKKEITEHISSLKLSYGPFSFFQNNTQMAEIVFEDIAKEIYGEVIDLCCGVGSIGLFVADKAKAVTGVENIKEAIDYAHMNAQQNTISNVHFFTDDMKHILEYTPLDVDVLILDPPRAGLGNKVVKKILELAPKKILYMSCNPKTQYEDFKGLLQEYELVSLKAYDLFPQTPHVETLAILKKK
jgi:23S rRNA (uracil1939-C5)-methyltransferase